MRPEGRLAANAQRHTDDLPADLRGSRDLVAWVKALAACVGWGGRGSGARAGSAPRVAKGEPLKHFRPFQHRSEVTFLPPSLQEWVPADHVVHFIADVLDRLDLTPIMAVYDNPHGNPPYHPKVMVGILLYAYARGVRSSRQIERMCYEDIPMRVLAGNVQPDHWTISNFRRRHLEALGELFVQTVRLAQEVGLVRLGHVALDGTKVKANASKHSAMSYGYMKQERERLRAEILQELQAGVAVDDQEDHQVVRRCGDELPPQLVRRAQRLAAIDQAMAKLRAEAAEAAPTDVPSRGRGGEPPSAVGGGTAEGRVPPPPEVPGPGPAAPTAARPPEGPAGGVRVADPEAGPERRERQDGAQAQARQPVPVEPPDRAQYNFTDPDSRIMLTSSKAFEQCYNAQIAVDAEHQIILAAELTNQAADAPHLMGLVDQTIQNSGGLPAEVSADAGYFHAGRVEELSARGIDVFIPPGKVPHRVWREESAPPDSPPPADASVKDRMRWKLRTSHGRARYRLRQQTVEPVFGQIKWSRGLRQLLLRGLAAARASWRFECAVHNMLKIHRAGVRLA